MAQTAHNNWMNK